MSRTSYAYWYGDKPLYRWCKENDVNYFRCVEFLYKYPKLNVKDAVEYVRSTSGTGIKYSTNGVSIRKLLGPKKYIKFTTELKKNKDKTWQEIYESCS